MSRWKQIEEIAWDLCDVPKHPNIKSCEECKGRACHAKYYAERAYHKSYRKQEWISVDERLPQVTGKYICCVKDKVGNTWTIPADWSLEMKAWFGEFEEIKNMVTHWMPLPEPPKMKGAPEK